MQQPDVSLRVVGAMRGLADDIGRSFLLDELGLDSGAVSRILQAVRHDGQAIRPTLGLAEQLLHRARRDANANGRRARVEELLTALVGEPVSLCVPQASGPHTPATPADVERDLLSVVQELGALAAAGAAALADRRVEPEEAEATIRQALDARLAIDNYVRALQEAAHRG